MSERVVKHVVRLGAIVAFVAMMGANAWAQCVASTNCAAPPCLKRYYYSSGGTTCCRCMCSGSVDETILLGAFGGRFCHTAQDTDCGVFGLTVYGTEDTDTYPCPSPTDPTDLDPKCGISAAALYQNPGGNFNFNVNAQPFVKPGFLTTSSNADKCDKNGKCFGSLTLDFDITEVPPAQNPGWQYLGTLFLKFKAVRTLCPGGYDVTNQCCTTDGRTDTGACGDGNVYGNGQPLTDLQLCVIPNVKKYQPGTQVAYDCSSPKNLTCGGLTGITCLGPLP